MNAKSPFTKAGANATLKAFTRAIKGDPVPKFLAKTMPHAIGSTTKKMYNAMGGPAISRSIKYGAKLGSKFVRNPMIRKAAGISMKAGIAIGGLAMVAVGMMNGANNAAQNIVAQRYIQDQRYSRNITMMSRLGYSSGTNSMNRYNHTAGLSQALSANRHGRGGY